MGEFIEPQDQKRYSVPVEAQKLFLEQVLLNPQISKHLPEELLHAGHKVRFTGSDLPRLPVNWRVAESSAALHALVAVLVGLLVEKKYGVDAPEVEINTDHAILYPLSLFLWTIDPEGERIEATSAGARLEKYIPNTDLHRRTATRHRAVTTNIYKCADGRWFQLHGSLNPDPVLDAIGLPRERDVDNVEQAKALFQTKIATFGSSEIREKMVAAGQPGDVCNSLTEYLASEQGKANSHVGLFELKHHPSNRQKPVWWAATNDTTSSRPLAGLKVIDMTRIIAAPAVTRGLAELGASVLRITSPKLPDFHSLHPDLNWGKWNAHLDLHLSEDRETLKSLILEADVVVSGYRPFVLKKYGFDRDGILELVSARNHGIIFAQVDTYGWHGPSMDRPGYQPVSDACVGISHGFGKAMGLADGEPVTALFPTSDYSTGLAGVAAVLSALIQRAQVGGSYSIDLALNYYNRWLAQSCGEYPDDVWDQLWASYGRFQFRSDQAMEHTAPIILKMMRDKGCLEERFFQTIHSGALGVNIRCVAPVMTFPNGEIKLGFNVGARGNGLDQARWPMDLTSEVVT
ncbi:hypothetical protein H2204_013003 [Knufia peltigerae]|uniref:Uncharacterized protein n=1 Tax=Knufia peltigerae TaxID=1002370 RepID=A0AA38XRF0_9EURO|nr:hypothetical protein H2204_013003 [Knufia peltigerae]